MAQKQHKRQNPWPLSDQALAFVEQFIQSTQRRRIIECGSGASTHLLAELKQAGKIASFTSLEHLDHFHRRTCRRLEQAGFDSAPVVHAPIVHHPNGLIWYDLTSIQQHTQWFDCVLIDGPPGNLRNMARYPAIPLLAAYCEPDALILVDDCHRPDEQAAIAAWQQQGCRYIDSLGQIAILQMG